MTQSGPVPLADGGPARRNRVWLVAAAVAAILAVGQLLAALLGLAFGPRGMETVQGFGGALAAWWFARGAWLRTARGRPADGTEAPWDEPAPGPLRPGAPDPAG